MQKRWLIASTLIIAGLILAACGSIAEEPRPTFEPPPTFDLSVRKVNADTDSNGEHVAVQPTDTPVPPTDTPEPTAVPPTDTPEPTEALPTDTPEPTDIPVTNTPEASSVDPTSIGDPENGQQLFTANACVGCHNIEVDAVLVGPSLLNVKDRAGERVEGQTAVEYIRNSIINPNDYLVEGFPAGQMPQTYGTTLSEQQINDLIAYLFTLE